MNDNHDIRWIQRLANYEKALARLETAVALMEDGRSHCGEEDELMKEGLVQRYEYTQELAWKVMKDYEEYQGYSNIQGSRDAIRLALSIGIISDRAWMDTIAARNLMSHCYDEEEFVMTYEKITSVCVPLFRDLCNTLLAIRNNLP